MPLKIDSTIGTTIFYSSDKRQFRCPVHGITTKTPGKPDAMFIGNAIDRTPHIAVSLYDKPRYHCLLCYAEWLKKSIPQLEEVPEDEAAKPIDPVLQAQIDDMNH